MRLLKQAHTVYKTQHHIVWVSRYRRKILVKGIEKYLEKLLLDTQKYFPDMRVREVGCDEDLCQ